MMFSRNYVILTLYKSSNSKLETCQYQYFKLIWFNTNIKYRSECTYLHLYQTCACLLLFGWYVSRYPKSSVLKKNNSDEKNPNNSTARAYTGLKRVVLQRGRTVRLIIGTPSLIGIVVVCSVY